MSIKFLVLGGGGDFFFWGGKCRFYFYGREDSSEYFASNKPQYAIIFKHHSIQIWRLQPMDLFKPHFAFI